MVQEDPVVQEGLAVLEDLAAEVAAGRIAASTAARNLLAAHAQQA